MGYVTHLSGELYVSSSRRLGAAAVMLTAPAPKILSQSQVFGPRPGGADGLRQDHMFSLYKIAMSSPGSSASIGAVVELYTTANQLYDPINKVQMNNPAATRNDARAALAKLASQGWQNVNSLNPKWPAAAAAPPAPKPAIVLTPSKPAAPTVPGPGIPLPAIPSRTDEGFMPPINPTQLTTSLVNRAKLLLAPITAVTSSTPSGARSTSYVPAPSSAYDGGAAAVAAPAAAPAPSSSSSGLLWGSLAAVAIVGVAVAASRSR